MFWQRDPGIKTVACFPAHPSQLWLMVNVVRALPQDIQVIWVLRDKDILIALAERLGLNYTVISRAGTGLVGNALEMLVNIFRARRITRRRRVDLWLTKYGAGNIAAFLARVPSLSFNDDDIDVVPLIAATSYPFARRVLAPASVRMGRYEGKTLRYRGSHELVYLHPRRFSVNHQLLAEAGLANEPFILVRLSGLAAHHDIGIGGMSHGAVARLIADFSEQYRIVISSEKPLPAELANYQMRAPVDHVHHLVAAASCLVTDSLSMALEAAVLGTATVRLSDFGLALSAFQTVEPYGLVANFKPGQVGEALTAVAQMLELERRGEIVVRSRQLVEDMEDPLPVFVNAILEHLPA